MKVLLLLLFCTIQNFLNIFLYYIIHLNLLYYLFYLNYIFALFYNIIVYFTYYIYLNTFIYSINLFIVRTYNILLSSPINPFILLISYSTI